jgi:hypothetical protein
MFLFAYKKKIPLAILVLFLSAQAFAAIAKENPWVLKRNREGIQIYTRKVAGSPILEFRTVMIVNSPLEKTIEFFDEEKRIQEWFHRCAQAELVERISPDEERVYFVADMIWPFSDRDGVYRSVKATDPVNGTVIYTIFADNGDYPEQKNKVRIRYLRTEWRFTPLEGSRTRVEYQQHSGAGGFIPPLFVNIFIVNIPFKTFKNFRDLLQLQNTKSIGGQPPQK